MNRKSLPSTDSLTTTHHQLAAINRRALNEDMALRESVTASKMLRSARMFGPGAAWRLLVICHAPSWTPHQRKRFATWCMLHAVSQANSAWATENLLRAVDVCRILDKGTES
jgi:hypothetical protein